MFPKQIKKVSKFCQEWHEQTKEHTFPWPKEGTFDINIIEHTKTYIKAKYAGQKRDKRELILDLLALFEESKAEGPTPPATSEESAPPIEASAPPPPYAGMNVLTPAPLHYVTQTPK